ncbi:MAG: helix-turn-helix domain-containing protein [Hydrogenophaga sp.]
MAQTPSALPAAPANRLAMIEQARRAVLDNGNRSGVPSVASWIERSWKRCLAQGHRPQDRVSFNAVSAAAVGRALEANQPLLRAATPVIESLARAMADSGYFAILTDAQGVVIGVNGPVDHHNRHAQLIARVGVDLSEQAVGTTAIGATLTELQPVWLHRGEHFFEDTGVYSCAGAPLFGPDGQCMGMLDLTGVNMPERPALKHLVTQSAQRIENAVLLAQAGHLLLRVNWPGHAMGTETDGLVCVDAHGCITGTNRHAAHMLGLAGGVPWPHCDDLFAVSHDALCDAARAGRPAAEQPLWSGLRVQVLPRLHQPTFHVPPSPSVQRPPLLLKDLEEALIRKAVQEARGKVSEAARALGISRATVYRKLQRRKPLDD